MSRKKKLREIKSWHRLGLVIFVPFCLISAHDILSRALSRQDVMGLEVISFIISLIASDLLLLHTPEQIEESIYQIDCKREAQERLEIDRNTLALEQERFEIVRPLDGLLNHPVLTQEQLRLLCENVINIFEELKHASPKRQELEAMADETISPIRRNCCILLLELPYSGSLSLSARSGFARSAEFRQVFGLILYYLYTHEDKPVEIPLCWQLADWFADLDETVRRIVEIAAINNTIFLRDWPNR